MRYAATGWRLLLAVWVTGLVGGRLSAADWLHWRGPAMTGQAFETNLPEEWDPRTVGKNNLVWKQPYGCRSTPLVMNGKVYIIGPIGDTPNVPTPKEKMLIAERVVCFDAKTGKVEWEQPFNVFHTDIVTNRLGWAPLAGDATTKRIYCHTTAGFLACLDAGTGKIVWQRQLTEEFGRTTGYGGRIGGGPIFDSGLVIVGLVNSNWGNHAPGGNRYYAFDGQDGKVVWVGEVPNIPVPGTNKGTYYSNPVTAVINGERLLITGGSDGSAHAFQVRTGKRVWSYPFALGVINGSPVVDGNLVYVSHGEENPEGAKEGLGRVVCLDASQVVDEKPKLVWEFRKGIRFGLASPALADGKLYVPDDAAKLYCFEAKKGKLLWKYNYGTTSRGSPLVADGKIYISETNAKFHIIKLKDDGSEPDEEETHTVFFKNKPGASGFVEVNCTPSIADGCLYLATRDELYCVSKGAGSMAVPVPMQAQEKEGDASKGTLQILPADVIVHPGETIKFELKYFTSTGMPAKLEAGSIEWTLPEPPLPKGAKSAPPPLKGTIKEGVLVVDDKTPSQAGYVDAKMGNQVVRARVRVAPKLPYKQDFERVPEGAVPSGWVNTQAKYNVVEVEENGQKNKMLRKVNTDPRPPIARANAYITTPDASHYTIEADIKCVEVRGKLPDAGIIGNRYTLYLDGKPNENGSREVQLLTWEALTPVPGGRVRISKDLNWKSGVWYRLKLTVETTAKEAIVKGKVWERDQKEPEEWTLTLTDPLPNKEGAAALYGYITNASDTEPGSEIYYDNVVITPNTKK